MMKLKRKLHLFRFIQEGNAGISVMFAIILPLLIATFSLGIDGSRFLIKRARLADALSQGSFAVASTNTNLTTEQEKIEGKDLVRSYINYYLPGSEIDESTLKVNADIVFNNADVTKIDSIKYVAIAKIIEHPIIDGISNALPGFSKDISILADENNGIVRKTMGDVNIESDIAFAVDFSGSMLGMSGGKMRIQILRDVVNDLVTQIDNEKSKSKIAIVPFDIGIPVKLDKKNEAGGDRIGCATPYKFKDQYDIDHAFWENKKIDWSSSGYNTSGVDRNLVIQSYLDLKRYDYYYNHVRPAIGSAYQSYCVRNNTFDNTATGGSLHSNPLSCEAVNDVSVMNSVNYNEIQNYSQIVQDYFYPLINDSTSQSFANDTTINYAGTISDSFLFDDDSIKPFERSFASIDMGNPFKAMCLSAFNISVPVGPTAGFIPSGYPYWRPDNYYSEYLSKIKQNAYVIGLSNDKSEIDQFQAMWPQDGAGTDIIAGILYAAREVAKGDNPRKIIIIVSDGEEYGEQETVGVKFRRMGMCQKVMDGIKANSPKTKEAKIYFVSIVNNAYTSSTLWEWRRNCVGDDGAFVATDYSALKNAITSIFSTEPGGLKFINKNDGSTP
ncbi:TadE/TadG family type IV pilus assembly protein [Citrobacter amalonaticus]|nr:TadE/TadG family type IV pilus assembly protein [Citrobacter amalonaticus]